MSQQRYGRVLGLATAVHAQPRRLARLAGVSPTRCGARTLRRYLSGDQIGAPPQAQAQRLLLAAVAARLLAAVAERCSAACAPVRSRCDVRLRTKFPEAFRGGL